MKCSNLIVVRNGEDAAPLPYFQPSLSTAGYFRIESSGGTVIIQGTVGEADDDPVPDLILTNASITSGQNVAASALGLTF